jgi:uncharacterized protein
MNERYVEWIPILKNELKIEIDKTEPSKRSAVHQVDHLERVWEKAEKLGKRLSADMEVLVASVFLHDIGRHYVSGKHGPDSAKHAEDVLRRIDFPKEKRDSVLKAIATHDTVTPPSERDTIEAKILYDADKLDSFGKIGIERHNKFFLEKCKTPQEELETLEKIFESLKGRWNGLGLEESKKVAKDDFDLIYTHFEKRYRDLKHSLKN